MKGIKKHTNATPERRFPIEPIILLDIIVPFQPYHSHLIRSLTPVKCEKEKYLQRRFPS